MSPLIFYNTFNQIFFYIILMVDLEKHVYIKIYSNIFILRRWQLSEVGEQSESFHKHKGVIGSRNSHRELTNLIDLVQSRISIDVIFFKYNTHRIFFQNSKSFILTATFSYTAVGPSKHERDRMKNLQFCQKDAIGHMRTRCRKHLSPFPQPQRLIKASTLRSKLICPNYKLPRN